MAKNSFKTSFAKAQITLEEGKFIITEYNKDDIKAYDLTEFLTGLVGVEGISLSANKDSELTQIEE